MAKYPKSFKYERAIWTKSQMRRRVLWTSIVSFILGIALTLAALQHYGFIDIVRRV